MNIDFSCINSTIPPHLLQEMIEFVQGVKKIDELSNVIARGHLEFMKGLNPEDKKHGSIDNFIKMTLFKKECWTKLKLPIPLMKYDIEE